MHKRLYINSSTNSQQSWSMKNDRNSQSIKVHASATEKQKPELLTIQKHPFNDQSKALS